MNLRILFLALLWLALSTCSKNPTIETPDSLASDYTGTVSVEYEGAMFDNPGIKVRFIVAENGTEAEIIIYRIKFVPKMPVRVDVTIPEVKVTPDGSGVWRLKCNDVDPLALGGKEPKYHVTGLEGYADDSTLEFSLKFGQYPTFFSGTR